jgi:hypothetical protein
MWIRLFLGFWQGGLLGMRDPEKADVQLGLVADAGNEGVMEFERR